VWTANLASLELHTHMWRVGDGGQLPPDMVVFDLDPGSPATIVECCQVAQLLRPLLEARPAGALARRVFPHHPGSVSAGALPAGWVRRSRI